jgi:hypothetical protein
MASLTEEVAKRVRQTTHGRIRDLSVREDHGRILVRGQAPSQYAKQLALHGALELLSGDRLRAEITVAKWDDGDRDGRGRCLDRVRPRRPFFSQLNRGVRPPKISS